MISRNILNFILDLVALLDLIGMTFTGVIMKYILPPGSGGRGQMLHGGGSGINVKDFWSMTRHEWGSIHFYMSVIFIALIVIHIILHWTWVKQTVKSAVRRWSFRQ